MVKLINTLSILLIVLFSHCDRDPTPDLTCNGRIKAEDINEIKVCLQGNWKILQTKTEAGTVQTLSNSYLNIKPNDSIYFTHEGNIAAESMATWRADTSPVVAFTNWKDELFTWTIDRFVYDTLFLNRDNIQYALVKSTSLPSLNCNVVLRDKALNQIRNCIYGNWQLHYRFGGFTGSDKDYYTTQTLVNFNASDSIEYIGGGNYSRYKINWAKTKDLFGEMTYIMGFENTSGYPVRWGVAQIRQDTLVLYDNWPDGYSYYLSKIK